MKMIEMLLGSDENVVIVRFVYWLKSMIEFMDKK